MLRGMKDDLPTAPARRRWWRVLGWGMLVAAVAICGWSGWRAYDYRAAVREARAVGVHCVEITPWAAIRADWRAALRLATWTEHQRVLELPAGTDLAPLRPLLLRLDPTFLRAHECRHLDALRGLTRMRVLEITLSEVKDLAPLAGLAHLQSLYIGGCTGVADLAPLAGLAQLRVLHLHGCTGLGAGAVVAFKKSHPQVRVSGLNGLPVNAE